MKSFFIFLLFFSISLSFISQSKLNVIGGQFNILTEQDAFSFNLNPYYGRRIMDKWTVGMELGYNNNTRESNGAITQRLLYVQSKYSAGIFGRYIHNNDMLFTIIASPRIRYTLSKSVDRNFSLTELEEDIDEITKGKQLSIGGDMGVLCRVSEKFNLLITLGELNYFMSEKTNNVTKNTEKDKRFRMSLNRSTIKFGIELVF